MFLNGSKVKDLYKTHVRATRLEPTEISTKKVMIRGALNLEKMHSSGSGKDSEAFLLKESFSLHSTDLVFITRKD